MRLKALGLVAVLTGFAAAAPAAAAAKQGIVEVPSAVVTEGLTVDQAIQRQAELAASLIRELPLASKSVFVPVAPAEIGAIDAIDRSTSPLPIGFVKPVAPSVNLAASRGDATVTADGGVIWAVTVRAESAGALRLHIDNVQLPDGVQMYVYSRSGEAYGPYVGKGPDGSGEFWATSVFGTEAIVQIKAVGPDAAQAFRGATARIGEVGIITPGFVGPTVDAPTASFCGNPACIVDASCYAGANSIRDAYAKMEWVAGAFLYTCTAGLLNDTNPSSTNYALTANHCLSKSNVAKNVSFYWRFRTSTCNGSCPSNSGWPYKTTGSSVAASARGGDFTLLALTAAPPAGSVRLGFTNAPVANTNGVPLHRVSNPNFGPQVYNEQTVNTSAPTCQGWPRGERIYSHDTLGGTDGGSSGSPVVNASDQVVGQLSGGCGTNVNDPCDSNANSTVDGALAFYWSSVQPIIAP